MGYDIERNFSSIGRRALNFVIVRLSGAPSRKSRARPPRHERS
jgi:hypothetical protein